VVDTSKLVRKLSLEDLTQRLTGLVVHSLQILALDAAPSLLDASPKFVASDLTVRFAVRSGFLNAQLSKLLYASTVAKKSARKFLTLFAKLFASQ
jgi:hypothetical protein